MGGFLITAFFWNNVVQENPQEKPSFSVHSPHTSEVQKKSTSLFFRRPNRHQKIEKKNRLQKSLRLKRVTNRSYDKPVTIVFAPHPDDEILCCSQKIENKVKNGERVKVVFFTDGDAHDRENAFISRAYGKTRKQESMQALSRLGVRSTDLFFLGFPDGTLQELKTGKVVRSDFTNRKKSSKESSFPFTEYSYENLENNLKKILNKYHIEEVYIPSETKDEHPDHKFVGELVSRVLEQEDLFPRKYEYTVHGKNIETSDSQPVNKKKLSLIRLFKSQFHTKMHEAFMEKWAKMKEEFDCPKGKVAREGNE